MSQTVFQTFLLDLGKMFFTLARKAFGGDPKHIIKDLNSILVA